MTQQRNRFSTGPLMLLLRVNGLQNWRRLKALRHQSWLLNGVIFTFLIGYLALSFWLFSRGLRFVAAFPGLGPVLTERLLYLLFAFLFALLLLSNLVISYTNLFRNREATFLLTMPFSWQTIFRWKFIESTVLASWAFLFLIAPLLAAFGMSRGVAWHFYVLTVFLVTLFIILPAVAGTWIAVCLARYLDRRSFQLLVGLLILSVIFLGAVWWKAQPTTDEILESRVLEMLDQMLVRTRFSQFPFLPSYWLASSVLQWTEGAVRASGFFMLVLLSHVGFFGCITFTRFGPLFYDGASAVFGRPKLRFQWGSKRPGSASITESVWNRLAIIPPDARALILKDVRTFWRDTAQWGQTVMLFGLLSVYIANLRHFTHQLTSPFWINLISYLNLAACSLNLATLTTRFVFPQFSLEGQRLWIVGMAPMGLGRVVKTKYWLASTASLMVTVSLITLSSVLLKMSWDRIAYFTSVVVVMTFTLNGLAIGLGVLYPNFKEAQPSKIVSGFGGTLCLVVSFLYILASVLLLGLGTTGQHTNPAWVFSSVAGFTVISFFVGWLPLKLGLWQLPKFEV